MVNYIKLKFDTLSYVERRVGFWTHSHIHSEYYMSFIHYHVNASWQPLTDKGRCNAFLCETKEQMSESPLRFFHYFCFRSFQLRRDHKNRGEEARTKKPVNEPFSRIGDIYYWLHPLLHMLSSSINYVPYFILQHVQDKNYHVTYEAYENDDEVIMVFLPFHLWIILCKKSLLNKSQGY